MASPRVSPARPRAATVAATHIRFPSGDEAAWSALVAGIVGGLLYALLARTVHKPVAALWLLSLGIATIDSLMMAFLPMPAGRGPHFPLAGIVEGFTIPLRQLGALVGAGHFGPQHYPTRFLGADTLIHYIPAVAASVLIPRITGESGSVKR